MRVTSSSGGVALGSGNGNGSGLTTFEQRVPVIVLGANQDEIELLLAHGNVPGTYLVYPLPFERSTEPFDAGGLTSGSDTSGAPSAPAAAATRGGGGGRGGVGAAGDAAALSEDGRNAPRGEDRGSRFLRRRRQLQKTNLRKAKMERFFNGLRFENELHRRPSSSSDGNGQSRGDMRAAAQSGVNGQANVRAPSLFSPSKRPAAAGSQDSSMIGLACTQASEGSRGRPLITSPRWSDRQIPVRYRK